MGQTTQTLTIGDIVASTLPNVRSEIVDNIHKKNVYLAKMLTKNRKKSFEGGVYIHRTVEYARNTTTTSFAGWDLVPIVPQETITDSIWTPKNYAANWAVSWEEERQNAGSRTKIRDVVEQKKNSMETSFSEELNGDILNPASFIAVGNSGKDITPLSMLVSDAALTVGSISETTNSWWANQRKTSSSSGGVAKAGSIIKKEMRNFYNTCGKNGDGFPDFVLTSQALYELYESILDNQVRYGSTEMASLGFDTVMLKNAEVAWDQLMPGHSASVAAMVAYNSGSYAEEAAFFLNTKYLYLLVDSGADFTMTPAVDHLAGGQFGKSGAMVARLEHVCTNRRAQGIYKGVDESEITLTT